MGARVFRHHEVEIEALSDEGLAALDGLVRELEARFAPALRRWTLSKLDLGRQLEKLVARRGVAGLASLADDLLPATYELLAKGD